MGGGYVNVRVLRLPTAIGLMAMALGGSLIILALGGNGWIDEARVQRFVIQVDFANVSMHDMLGLLLFAGALHVDLRKLASNRSTVAALALGGTLLSTAIVGTGTFYLLRVLGQPLPFAQTLLFGALIAPTDPIAVLGILKSARVPERLAVQVSGESLFNDGIAVVLFLVIGAFASGRELSATDVVVLFAREALGGSGAQSEGVFAPRVSPWFKRVSPGYLSPPLQVLAMVAQAIGTSWRFAWPAIRSAA